MNIGILILANLVDDFGNEIPVYLLPSYAQRYNYLKGFV